MMELFPWIVLLTSSFFIHQAIASTLNNDAAIMEELETIFLRLYIGKSMDKYIDCSLENSSMFQTRMIASRPIVLYIHGFTENLEKESARTVIQAYLKRDDHNVIGLDYGKIANGTYPQVVKNFPFVGAAVTAALEKMVKSGFNPEKLYIIGHSLGAQIAGYIGRKVSFKIPRITEICISKEILKDLAHVGLDPAGPLFNILEPRLSSSDARFVDIIHTDYGFYGIARITGTVDFFPNDGHRIQPGCPSDPSFYSEADFCSHQRSWRFYAESLLDESSFMGVQCSSSSRFNSGECNSNERIIMGYSTPHNATGSVYLKTNDQIPFGMHKRGAEAIKHNITTTSR